jgi:hypothetical protein
LLCRIGPTICYNYLNLLGLRVEDGISFSHVNGTLSTEQLKFFGLIGDIFSTFVPLTIPVIAIAILFDLDQRFLNFINIRTFIFFPIFSSAQNSEIEQGKRLVSFERKKRLSIIEGGDEANGENFEKFEKKGRSKFAQKMREREKEKKKNQPEEIPLEKLLGGDIIIDLE